VREIGPSGWEKLNATQYLDLRGKREWDVMWVSQLCGSGRYVGFVPGASYTCCLFSGWSLTFIAAPARRPPSLTHISSSPWDQRKPTYSLIIQEKTPIWVLGLVQRLEFRTIDSLVSVLWMNGKIKCFWRGSRPQFTSKLIGGSYREGQFPSWKFFFEVW